MHFHTRGIGVPPLAAALLSSPSGYAGVTDTTSTSAATIDEGHTGGTSDQPSSNDDVGEAGLSTTSR
jgi:hypothetical protein